MDDLKAEENIFERREEEKQEEPQAKSQIEGEEEDIRPTKLDKGTKKILNSVTRYISNVPGTGPYWRARENELHSCITRYGPPLFYFTFSSADYHWPELHKLLPYREEDK